MKPIVHLQTALVTFWRGVKTLSLYCNVLAMKFDPYNVTLIKHYCNLLTKIHSFVHKESVCLATWGHSTYFFNGHIVLLLYHVIEVSFQVKCRRGDHTGNKCLCQCICLCTHVQFNCFQCPLADRPTCGRNVPMWVNHHDSVWYNTYNDLSGVDYFADCAVLM